MNEIRKVCGRRVWDSRGRPTVEAEVHISGGMVGRAIAPAGASTGSGEAVDLRDGDQIFGGFDVRNALASVDGEIAKALVGMDATDQIAIDKALIALDNTPNKSRLGGNAIVSVSMAAAHAAAAAYDVPLWQYLSKGVADKMPLPEIQIFGGGAHAGQRVDIQDFMVMATGAKDYAEALDWTARVYLAAGKLMADEDKLQGVADEGGYWPAFDTNEAALDMLVRSIEAAGLVPGDQVNISLDIAASEFGSEGCYRLGLEERELDSDELSEMLLGWLDRYPILSVEDPLGEDDEAGLIAFTRAAGDSVQIIGDDFLVTNVERVRLAVEKHACNAVLVKPNQAGTLTEAKAAFDLAMSSGWGAVISARSGETEDVTIVHLAVGWGALQLKVGSFARSERMAKWNEGLRISDVVAPSLPPAASFPWGP